MANFAKIGINGKIINVVTLDNKHLLGADGIEREEIGRQYLENIHGWPLWKKTSYNTHSGKHWTFNENNEKVESEDQSKAFRGNYAGIGSIYDEDDDIFWPPKGFKSFIKDYTNFSWKAPIDYPTIKSLTFNGNLVNLNIKWDEDFNRWLADIKEDINITYKWNSIDKTWTTL
jgi:hypothetical protein